LRFAFFAFKMTTDYNAPPQYATAYPQVSGSTDQPQYAQPMSQGVVEQLMVQNCPKGLNIRSEPSVNGQLLGTLANGSVVVVQSRNGGWVQHQTGWSLASDGQQYFLMPFQGQQYMQQPMMQQPMMMQPQVMTMGAVGYGGVMVQTVAMPMCVHEWVDSGEPSLIAWLICCLTWFCCSLCICTRQRCRKCGVYLDV